MRILQRFPKTSVIPQEMMSTSTKLLSRLSTSAKITHYDTSGHLRSLRSQLLTHPLYRSVDTQPKLKIFMESHVPAVWDFMTLLKTLQRSLTCTDPIWTPPKNITSARFINSIVLGEETDEIKKGIYSSHYDLYLRAMRDVGARTQSMKKFVQSIERGTDPMTALRDSKFPDHCKVFVSHTLQTIRKPLPCVASTFYFGREDPIPQMFDQILKKLPEDKNHQYRQLRMYLERHIQVDAEDHGPLSLKLLEEVAENKEENWKQIIDSGISAIDHRIKLWDGILKDIKNM